MGDPHCRLHLRLPADLRKPARERPPRAEEEDERERRAAGFSHLPGRNWSFRSRDGGNLLHGVWTVRADYIFDVLLHRQWGGCGIQLPGHRDLERWFMFRALVTWPGGRPHGAVQHYDLDAGVVFDNDVRLLAACDV